MSNTHIKSTENEAAIRKWMKANGCAASVPSISQALGLHESSIRAALNRMPDTWIDRWSTTGGRPKAIWRIVPDDCPPPRKKT